MVHHRNSSTPWTISSATISLKTLTTISRSISGNRIPYRRKKTNKWAIDHQFINRVKTRTEKLIIVWASIQRVQTVFHHHDLQKENRISSTLRSSHHLVSRITKLSKRWRISRKDMSLVVHLDKEHLDLSSYACIRKLAKCLPSRSWRRKLSRNSRSMFSCCRMNFKSLARNLIQI